MMTIACLSPECTVLITLASIFALDWWSLVRLLELTICYKVIPYSMKMQQLDSLCFFWMYFGPCAAGIPTLFVLR